MNDTTADTVLAALSDHKQVSLFSDSVSALGIPDAYRVTRRLRSAFEARGESIIPTALGADS